MSAYIFNTFFFTALQVLLFPFGNANEVIFSDYYTAVQKYGVGKIYFNALEWTPQKPHLFDQK